MATLYGFHSLQDVLDQRASTIDQQILSDAIRAAVAAHNQDLNDSVTLFANKRMVVPQIGVAQQSEAELQGLDEWGRPLPRRPLPPVSRYFPLFMAGDSIATNYVLEQKMTVQEVQDRVASLMLADTKWNRRQLLSAVFTNVSYNFADPQYGTLPISTFANGDSETFLRANGGSASADTHHKGATALDNTVLSDIRDELVEHDENGGDNAEIVVFVPTASKATVQALTGFEPIGDPNMSYGTGNDAYVGSFGATAPGKPIGYSTVAEVHLREWNKLPANYAVGITSGAVSPLAYREDPEASLQGFHEIPGREDIPYLQRIWIRRRGYAAYNRVGVVVYRTNNATYAVPSGFQAPN